MFIIDISFSESIICNADQLKIARQENARLKASEKNLTTKLLKMEFEFQELKKLFEKLLSEKK